MAQPPVYGTVQTVSPYESSSRPPLDISYSRSVPTFREVADMISGFVSPEHIQLARDEGTRRSAGSSLTADEASAIFAYTLPGCRLADTLIQAMRSSNTGMIHTLSPFIDLLTNALGKLPVNKTHSYIGAIYDDHYIALRDVKFVWWDMMTCNELVESLDSQIQAPDEISHHRTLFSIEGKSIIDVSAFSATVQCKHVFYPGCEFRVVSQLDLGNNLRLVQLEEVVEVSYLNRPHPHHGHAHGQYAPSNPASGAGPADRGVGGG